ncbi:MAG: aminotransferase class I/II-fold pyridoxal phosphate-dependent enzyme [Kordiimonadaceae bacterium]|nr:aminotransferase class I/II-fold pyridoxal phosphate-dependent enzyme [Kordiimonadaceae bacterium]
MTIQTKLNRRFFMKTVGAGAVIGGTLGSVPLSTAAMGQMGGMSNTVNFDAGYDRVGTNSIKFDYIKMINPGKTLDVGMGIADMDFRTLPAVTSALKKRLEIENWGYELPPMDYQDNIVAWNKRRYNIDVPKANILNSLGVLDGVLSILLAFGKKGDHVLLTTPTYSSFFHTVHDAGMHSAESEMKRVNGRYEVDYNDFEKQIAGGVKLFILCNPQNPTGNCWTADEMRKMGDICNRHGCLVIADEIHCDFVMTGHKYTPYASLGDAYAQNSFTLKSSSKSFNLAAHRTAYFYSDNRSYIDRVIENGHQRLLLNVMGMIASNVALQHGDDYIDEQNAYLTENTRYVAKFCADRIPLIKYQPHEGTYLAWLDCTGLYDKLDAHNKARELTDYNTKNNITEMDFFEGEIIKKYNAGRYVKEWVMDQARVDINAGQDYGKGGDGFMRMNLATNRAMITKALSNIEAAINAI